MLRFLIAGVVVVALASPAKTEGWPAASALSWNGAYVGGQVSYGFGDADLIFNTKNDDGHFWDLGQSIDGTLAGVQAGYDMQFGNIVVGVLGSLSFADISGARKNPQDGSNFVGPGSAVGGPPVRFSTTIDTIATIASRTGLLLNDRTLIYGHGGLAFADVTLSGSGGPANAFKKQSDWVTGWTAGAGLEMKFTETISGFVQYSHVSLDQASLHIIADGDDYKGAVNNQGRDLNVFTVGVNFRLQ